MKKRLLEERVYSAQELAEEFNKILSQESGEVITTTVEPDSDFPNQFFVEIQSETPESEYTGDWDEVSCTGGLMEQLTGTDKVEWTAYYEGNEYFIKVFIPIG